MKKLILIILAVLMLSGCVKVTEDKVDTICLEQESKLVPMGKAGAMLQMKCTKYEVVTPPTNE